MTTIRPITFDELQTGMILGVDNPRPETFFVQNATKVEQFTETLCVELLNTVTKTSGNYDKWTWGEHDFEGRGISLIGEIVNGNATYYTPAAEAEYDTVEDPDPAIHEAFIKSVNVGGELFQLGERIDGVEITKITLEDETLYYYNKNGALICQTGVRNVVYQVRNGWRLKEVAE